MEPPQLEGGIKAMGIIHITSIGVFVVGPSGGTFFHCFGFYHLYNIPGFWGPHSRFSHGNLGAGAKFQLGRSSQEEEILCELFLTQSRSRFSQAWPFRSELVAAVQNALNFK